MDIDVEVDVGIDRHFGCFKKVSTSVEVLLNGLGAAMVLTRIVLK